MRDTDDRKVIKMAEEKKNERKNDIPCEAQQDGARLSDADMAQVTGGFTEMQCD